MDYTKHYNLLIESRKRLKRKKNKKTYYENHHIIPRSMGGSDTKNNLVLLTPREHFIAHWLLYKIHNNKEMSYAFWLMCCFNEKFQYIKTNSKTYEKLKLEIKDSLTGWTHTEEAKQKMRKKSHTDESKKKIGEGNKKPKPKEFSKNLKTLMKNGLAKKISEANKGISRNKGRKNPWSKGNNKTTIIYQFLNDILIYKWVGTSKLGKKYSLSRVYNSLRTGKKYKNYIWKKEIITKVK